VTPEAEVKDAYFRVEIQNKHPVELVDFTQSFLGVADEFRGYALEHDPEVAATEVRLYIRSIHDGSIIADLMPLAPSALPFLSYTNTVIDFCKHLKSAYDYLSGVSDEKPELIKSSYKNLSQIVEPVAKDRGSQINIGNVNNPVFIVINSTQANAIQNAGRRELEALREPETGLHEKVLLYWYQARGDVKSKTGDRAIVESINSIPVKAICANDTIKTQMVLDAENPFKQAYVVDVLVETIGGKPALYKIVALHESFDRDD